MSQENNMPTNKHILKGLSKRFKCARLEQTSLTIAERQEQLLDCFLSIIPGLQPQVITNYPTITTPSDHQLSHDYNPK